MDRRRKSKAITNNLTFVILNITLHVSMQQENQVGLLPRTSMASEGRDNRSGLALNDEGQQALAKHIQDWSSWNCLIFIFIASASSWGSWSPGEQVRTLTTREGIQQSSKGLDFNPNKGEGGGSQNQDKANKTIPGTIPKNQIR